MDMEEIITCSKKRKNVWDLYFTKYYLLSQAGLLDEKEPTKKPRIQNKFTKRGVSKRNKTFTAENTSKQIIKQGCRKMWRCNSDSIVTVQMSKFKRSSLESSTPKAPPKSAHRMAVLEEDCKTNGKNCTTINESENNDEVFLNNSNSKPKPKFTSKNVEQLNEAKAKAKLNDEQKHENAQFKNYIRHVCFTIEEVNKSNLRYILRQRDEANDQKVFNKLHLELKTEMARLSKLNVSKNYLKDFINYVTRDNQHY